MNAAKANHSFERLFHGAEENARGKAVVLLFMATLYPLVIVPGRITGFTLPKYTALGLAAGFASILLITGRPLKLERRPFVPLALFLLSALIAALLAPDPLMAWFGLYRYTGFCTYLFCAVLFLLAADCRPEQALNVLKWMTAAAAAVSFVGILQYLGFNFIPHYYHGPLHPYATVGNRNFLGTYTVFILPAAVYFYLHSRKVAWLLCTALVYAGLLVSLTRGAWIALPLPLLLLYLHFSAERSNRKYIGITCAVLLLTTGLLAPVRHWELFTRASTIPDQIVLALELVDSAGSGRIFIWKEALRLIPKNWAFGIGPDSLSIPLGPGYFADKAHNIYLEIAVTMGLFALSFYLWFLSCFLRLRKNKNSVLFFTMILAYLIQGFFNIDVVGVMPLFWITLGLSIAQGNPCRKIPGRG